MLDKILNITPGSDYKNSSSTKGYREFFLAKNNPGAGAHDSVSFSPAWLFISQLNWQILSVKMPKEEKLSLTFLINDIEFHTEIDLNDLNYSSTIHFSMSQKKVFTNVEKSTIIELEKRLVYKRKMPALKEYKGLAKLFERTWNLNVNYELSNEDCHLNTLLEEIYIETDAELEFISVSLISFIEKLLNKSFSYNFIKENDSSPNLTIKRIKSSPEIPVLRAER